jgi:hypothetical protein
MLAIVVFAGLFAAFGVIGALELVVVLAVPFLPIILAAPGRRLGAAVWVTSLYPFLILASFYATWLTAWWILGHRPRPNLDDPRMISPVVLAVGSAPYILLTFGTPLVWFVCAPVILAVVYWNIANKNTPVWKGMMQLLIPVFAWVMAVVIWSSDLGFVINWYFD